MSRVVKFIKTLRNHWKKTTFAVVVSGYGVSYVQSKVEVFNIMRAYCEESKKFGESALPSGSKPRHVTVILNPAAGDGKGSVLFEKYAAPLLHLAGVRVSLIKTEHEGQAKALMDVMDNTDAVLVAGGDGTLLEVVTGLCRRSDFDVAVRRLPLGIIPIGRANTFAKHLFWGSHLEEAKLLAESAMAVVKGNTKPLNVMSIEGESGKPVYALSSLQWGIYRDVDTKISNYWYWGPLKSRMAYVFATFKKWGSPVEARLSWAPPCDGCSTCYEASRLESWQSERQEASGRRWWHSFIPRGPPRNNVKDTVDYSKVVNEKCGQWESFDVSSTDLVVETNNVFPDCKQEGSPTSLKLKIGPNEVGRTNFVLEGWRRNTDDEHGDDEAWEQVIAANEVKIDPKINEGVESWFSIDNEDHEAKFVHLKLLQKRIHVFCK